MYVIYIKIIFYSQSAKSYRIDKHCHKCREIPSQSRLVHNISVPPKCTVSKSGWIPWNELIISDNEVQTNYRAVVTKYIQLVFRSSIETKIVKPKQTAESNWAYKIYLQNVQCWSHENELLNLKHLYIYGAIYNSIFVTYIIGDLYVYP